MARLNWQVKLAAVLTIALTLGCQGLRRPPQEAKSASPAPPLTSVESAPPAAPVARPNTIPEAGLLLTKDGIEFAGVKCSAAYTSEVTGVVKDENNRVTAKTITSTCTSNGDTYTWVYSDIRYNSLGQMTGYKLKLRSSTREKEYKLLCSNILRDNLWEITSYKVRYEGKVYQFKRQ